MKRILTFVISFTLSFMFFFSSMAMAEEVQTPITQVTSKLTNPEIILQASPIKASSANLFNIGKENAKLLMDVNREEPVSSFSAICVKDQVTCPLPNGTGYCMGTICAPGSTIIRVINDDFISALRRFFRF